MAKARRNTQEIKSSTVRSVEQLLLHEKQIGIFAIHRGKGGMPISEVADHCDIKEGRAKEILEGMLREGTLHKERGRYFANKVTEDKYGEAYLEAAVANDTVAQATGNPDKASGQY